MSSTPSNAIANPLTTWQVHAAGQDFRLYVELEPLLHDILADIRLAQRRVWIETYTLGNDPAGQQILAALTERAAAGLDVRLMIDAIGSLDAPDGQLNELEAAGGKVHVYHSFGFALWQRMHLPLLNRRNHRKLIVIDNRAGYFGGMNLVDPSEGNRAAAWRDIHLRVDGYVLGPLSATMERLWLQVHDQPAYWPKWPTKSLAQDEIDGVWLFDSTPGLRIRRADRVFRPLIRGAKRSITLSMAYFIPQGGVMRELVRARKRGVTVRVIVPGVSDVPIVQWATEHFYATLLKHGFKVYERDNQMLHSKAMIVDDHWTVVGSCNLDPRSLRLNLEFLGAIRARELTRVVKHAMALELRQSRRVTDAAIAGRSWWQRLRGQVAWWFRRWL